MLCCPPSRLPKWRNGRRGRLKIYSRRLGAGSSPVFGIFLSYRARLAGALGPCSSFPKFVMDGRTKLKQLLHSTFFPSQATSSKAAKSPSLAHLAKLCSDKEELLLPISYHSYSKKVRLARFYRYVFSFLTLLFTLLAIASYSFKMTMDVPLHLIVAPSLIKWVLLVACSSCAAASALVLLLINPCKEMVELLFQRGRKRLHHYHRSVSQGHPLPKTGESASYLYLHHGYSHASDELSCLHQRAEKERQRIANDPHLHSPERLLLESQLLETLEVEIEQVIVRFRSVSQLELQELEVRKKGEIGGRVSA